jgi:phytoene synthase
MRSLAMSAEGAFMTATDIATRPRLSTVGSVRPPVLPSEQDWAVCRDVTKAHGTTFYFACQLLPVRTRQAIHAIYAWCRTADDVVDDAELRDHDDLHAQLDQWLAAIDNPSCPITRAFSWVLRAHGISDECAHDLVSGVRMDLDHLRFETWQDLRQYSYCVAGTVGLMTAPILGCRDDTALPQAVDLGIAMQLTNILRDVAEDAQMGRIYLPLEDLHRFGVTPESVLALQPDGDFEGLMRFEIARARMLYQSARPGIAALSVPGQVATLSGSQLYSKILNQIESRNYDVFDGRVSVSTSAKVREMPHVLAGVVRMQLTRQS